MSRHKSDSTETGQTDDTDHRYSEICGATNRNDNPCKLPAGWGTPGSGGLRCKFHGGLSSGPDDTSLLEGNDHAEGNPGGRPPNSHSNAVIHGGFSDWETAYERFMTDADSDVSERIEKFKTEYLETAAKHAADVDPERRERLASELATIRVLKQRAQSDVWTDADTDPDDDATGRGLVFEDTSGIKKVNPAHQAANQHKQRTRKIAEVLSLWAGFQ